MSLTTDQIRQVLDERLGKVQGFQIDFAPRVNVFRVISEERLIKLIRDRVNAFDGWEFVSLAFLPIGGNVDGFRVTVRRKPSPPQMPVVQAFAPIAPVVVALAWPVAVAIVAITAFVFLPMQIRRTFELFPREAITEVATGIKFAGFGVPGLVLLGLGFFVLFFVLDQ